MASEMTYGQALWRTKSTSPFIHVS